MFRCQTSYLLHGWINKHVKKSLNNISLIFLLEWAWVFWGNIGTSVIEEPFLWNSLYSIWFWCDAQHWIAHLKSPGIHHLFDAYTFSLSTTFLTKQKNKGCNFAIMRVKVNSSILLLTDLKSFTTSGWETRDKSRERLSFSKHSLGRRGATEAFHEKKRDDWDVWLDPSLLLLSSCTSITQL